jgi:hypothetical protein
MTATGGLLIFGIGVNLLTGGKMQIKVGSLLPAIFVAILVVVLFTHFHIM